MQGSKPNFARFSPDSGPARLGHTIKQTIAHTQLSHEISIKDSGRSRIPAPHSRRNGKEVADIRLVVAISLRLCLV